MEKFKVTMCARVLSGMPEKDAGCFFSGLSLRDSKDCMQSGAVIIRNKMVGYFVLMCDQIVGRQCSNQYTTL